ncbi:unnamed protein product [Adineta ricciae]|uniref:Uncharacterized protein n=1 Tax=Adineta ricciae TaxID=249248 RepID=A0A815WHZ0_ADIRI|nr:unnamed protein product [Adineta ricciae]CAF1548016.1 unnamed protein product [Adineta ricciae]
MASTCLFLSTFDRCLSTSRNVHWRQFSSMSFAKRLLILIMLFLLISSVICLIVYNLYNGICTTTPGFGTIIVIVYGNVFISLIPHGGMFICSIVTWIHLRQMRNRVDTNSGINNLTILVQRTNRQLLILIFTQAFLAIILEVQRDISATYSLITSSVKKSVEQQQIEYFLLQLSIILYYIKFAMPFYVNCAFSTLFRKTFRTSMKSLISRCFHLCQNN